MDPVLRSGGKSNSSRKSKSEYVCSGSNRSGKNKCSQAWRHRLDAIDNCEITDGCSHIGKFNDNNEMKFIILEAVQNGYFVDSPSLIVGTLQKHKNQAKRRLQRQRLIP